MCSLPCRGLFRQLFQHKRQAAAQNFQLGCHSLQVRSRGSFDQVRGRIAIVKHQLAGTGHIGQRGGGHARGADVIRILGGIHQLVIQLFGAEASFLQRAVEMLRDVGYGWFDLNMGCSVAKVLKQGAGAAMLGDVPNALEVARAMLQAAGPGRVGFKIRLGLDSQRHVWRDLSLRLQDLGAGWITLHPRTARQGFGGEAAHEVLAELKQALDIPLIASGDLFSARDGLRVLEQTGVDTVMYARGAMHGPAIFDDHLHLCRGEEPQPPSPAALRAMVLRHMELAQELCPGRAALWKMRSVVPRYVRSLPGVKALRLELCRCTSWEGLHELMDRFLPE